MAIFKNSLSKKGIWYIFSVCAFPVHVWTIILFLRDYSWISERTNAGDAIGVGSYGLLIALVESLFVFIVVYGINFVLSKFYSELKRIGIISILVLVTMTWAILGQLYFLLEINLPSSILRVMMVGGHPLWVLYGSLIALTSLSLALPLYFQLKSTKIQNVLFSFVDRLATLTGLYLFLDFCGLVIVIIRNV